MNWFDQKGAVDAPFLKAYVSYKNLRVLNKSWYSRNLYLHNIYIYIRSMVIGVYDGEVDEHRGTLSGSQTTESHHFLQVA